MSRLTREWICDLERTAPDWDRLLRERTGLGYVELAAQVSGRSENEIRSAAETMKVAAVPVTSGLGIIGRFSASVAAILSTMGFDTFVTSRPDVDGLYEASCRGADIVFLADDSRYIALNLRNGRIADNNVATVTGYMQVLRSMSGGLLGRSVVVLGYGVIGRLFAEKLRQAGASVAIYERNIALQDRIERDGFACVYDSTREDPKSALFQYDIIADATNEGDWLRAEDFQEHALIAAPGVPFSFDEASADKLGSRCIHDLLEIGTVSMLGLAL